MPMEQLADQAAERALDALYVSVGMGVLTFQRAQVRRRELEATLERHAREHRERLSGWLDTIERLDASVDEAVRSVTAQLPNPLGAVVGGVHGVAHRARREARDRVRQRLDSST